jgi:serine/threonine protein kinase
MLNQQFGNYKFLSVLGEGGMATVYLAENTLLGKKVAIKLLKQEFVNNSNIRGRFLAEARHMVQVSHAHIISVLDLIDAGDIVAIVMEYVDGQSLKEYLQQKGRLNDSEIRTLFSQILTALQHVHDSGFVHRDIKPSNFMLTRAGSIKLADFGIAKDLNKRFEMTETGTQMGTPIYMSPEQVRDSKDVDCRSDIYSLGVVLYEAITGSFPFDKHILSLPEIQVCILKNELPLTHTKWDRMIQKATAKNGWERYASCNAFIHDFLDETIPPLFPPPPTPPPPKQPNTIKPITVISVIAIVGLISVFSYKLFFPPSNKISELSFPYAQTEIVDFLARYYQMINSGNIDNYETFFEPIIDTFYRIPNMNSNLAKVDFEDNNLKKYWIQITYNQNDIVIINTNSDSANVSVRLKMVKTNKSDYSVKNFDILHSFSISKNLKISKLREKINRIY